MSGSGAMRSALLAGSARGLLIALGLGVGLALAEIALWIAGLPRFYDAHSAPPQFAILSMHHRGAPVYLNAPGTVIRFVYDSDPRGYFGDGNAVGHSVNSEGFRGEELSPVKGSDVLRIAFFGDSFTFGEGVKDVDVYPVRTAALLESELRDGRRVESLNFGVGGYNTDQSLYLLEWKGLAAEPDAIVLGYVLNDAEPPLFRSGRGSRGSQRRRRELDALEGAARGRPPEGPLYRLRSAQLVWQLANDRRLTRQTLDAYAALYTGSSPGWRRTRSALREMGRHCHTRAVPCLVVLFPLLHRLDDYPLGELHDLIQREVEASGMRFLDLLPQLQGREAEELWVHPSDQHPNEEVHAIAAEAISAELRALGLGS